MSLVQHKALIEQLKPLLMEANFQEVFEHFTKNETNSTRFLLKMELKRIAAPCTRIIDFRNKSELHCEEVTHGEQQHYLDEPSKAAFLEALALFRDNYTLGVYEQVTTAFMRRREKQQALKGNNAKTSDSLKVPGIVLGNYINRQEERMNYSIKIAVSQPGREELNGITVDLSVSGARIRVEKRHHFDLEKPLKIKLLELSEEYYFEDLQQGVAYQVVDTHSNQDHTWMRLKRIGGSEALSEMLANLITGYKFRYKVDINDVDVTASGLGMERHYLPHLPHLPLFIEQVNDLVNKQVEEKYQITHQLLSHDNKRLLNYFLDETDTCQLQSMLTNARLKKLLAHGDNSDHGLFFSFIYHINGKQLFYSASLAELKQTDLQALFFTFGSSKPSWRVFKLFHHQIDKEASYKASILPGDDSEYSPLSQQQLYNLTHVLQLVELSNPKYAQMYQAWNNGGNANMLKPFGQEKLKESHIKLVSLHFSERRHEARFAFKTSAVVTQGKQMLTGVTQDISNRGLQINLPESFDIDSKKPVHITFPRLQEAAGSVRLEKLPYHVVRSRKKGATLHLAAAMGHTTHVGVQFLSKLIELNKGKLVQLTENNSDVKEVAEGLKNLLMRRLISVPFFIEKTTGSAKLSNLGISTQRDDISALFAAGTENSMEYNLAPLLSYDTLKKDIIAPVKSMDPRENMNFFEVYLQVSLQSRGQIHLKCMRTEDIGDRKAQVQFIQQAQHLGKFVALRVYYGATGKPDLNYIRRELSYMMLHAQHKAKALEEKLWKVIGTGELLDVTDEVKLRYPELYQEEAEREEKAS